MLEVSNVHYRYERESRNAPSAVAGVSFSIRPGQVVALLGQNGSGKSTLAKLLAGILKPQSGAIIVDDIDTSDSRRIWEARRRVGLIFQNPDDQLITNTLIDDIAFGPENLGLPRAEIQKRVDSAIAVMALEPYLMTPLNELSVGLRQRVAIAGVLAMEPRYLILDEPSAMLPPHVATQLLESVMRLAHEQDIGVVYITHHMDETVSMDEIIAMSHGQIALQGSPRQVFAEVELLRQLSLEPPPATLLAQRLAARGYPVPPNALTSEELVEHLRPFASNSAAQDQAQDRFIVDEPAPTEPTAPSLNNAAPVIETRNLTFTYLKGTPFEQQALSGFSSHIPAGSFVAFVGPSRAGKSTLLDCLNAVAKPGKGMVFYQGEDTSQSGFSIEKLRQAVAVVYQSPDSQLIEDIVGKDVAFGLVRNQTPLAESRRIVQESLEAVGLDYEEFRNRYIYALSGGEKRRVAIARALAMRPTLLALDEPAAGLDPRGRAEFLELIRTLHRERGLTVVYMTASLEDVAELADSIYIMNEGTVALEGAPREILKRLALLEQIGVGLPDVAKLALALTQIAPLLDLTTADLDALERNLAARLLPPSHVAEKQVGS